jgi:chromatin remodeling complex protein RSC6
MPPPTSKKTPVATAKTAVPAPTAPTTPATVPSPAKQVDPANPTGPAKKKVVVAKTVPPQENKVEEPKVEDSEEIKLDEVSALSILTEKVATFATLLKEVQTALKAVTKEYEKQSKIIEKVQKKRENARKSPSGFAKPNKISDELCDFLGVPHGTEKSRTDVTRFINAYVKEHNLNNPSNKRVILPDPKLKSILNVKDGEEVTFFILQRLISHHFPLSLSKMNANAANNVVAQP